MKDSLNEILNAIRQKQFSNLSKGAKNLLIVIISVVVLIPLFVWLLGGSGNTQSEVALPQDTLKQTENNTPPPPILPPKSPVMESPMTEDLKTSEAENTQIAITSQNISQDEAIKAIEKKQRPNDLIAFLKENKGEFDFKKGKAEFKFEDKIYRKDDLFLGFFKILSITENYIRFYDDKFDYAYNLRFLDKGF